MNADWICLNKTYFGDKTFLKLSYILQNLKKNSLGSFEKKNVTYF